MEIGDRVRFIRKIEAFPYGWPYGRTGTIIEQPYRGVWYVCLDKSPLSKIPITPIMVEVL
jgi:hypothetical protein